MSVSPTIEGFRAAFRRPSFTLAEITWRWVVGATATTLLFFGLIEYLSTLPVTNGELMFMKTRQPYLVGQAIAHILRGSWNRAVLTLLLAGLMLVFLWILAASLGRAVTVPPVIEYFRRKVASDGSSNPFRALVRLNFLRFAVCVATTLGLVGAGILASFASTVADPRPGLAFVIFIPMAALVCLAGWVLNWLLSLSAVFAVRDREDAVGAISAAVTFCRERTGMVLAVSTWTGLAHIVVFFAFSTIASTVLGLGSLLPVRLVLTGAVLVTICYFAVADWLYMARLAGYVCIAEMAKALPQPLPPPYVAPSAPPVVSSVVSSIDRDELILSDV